MMMMMSTTFFAPMKLTIAFLSLITTLTYAQEITELTAVQFYERRAEFDVIIDVRSQSEWDGGGHIEGAFLVESLASFGSSGEITSPSDLAGCETCSILVYCNSGSRARAAIGHLVDAGFQGPLYNGQGVVQWTNEGYPLVNTPSQPPPCRSTPGQCAPALGEISTDGEDENEECGPGRYSPDCDSDPGTGSSVSYYSIGGSCIAVALSLVLSLSL